ncbi:hypothetical protein [Streptomyces tendae]|uniref:hypothetical protein n=1 Tax=Streptomyces tendae TaxID=1932 RepID=UPI003D702BD4
MPTPTVPIDELPSAAHAARLEAEHLWAGRTRLNPWTAHRLEDGTIALSAEVHVRYAPTALASFTANAYTYFEGRPGKPGDQLPALDVSVAGREACVWRTGGVWVELWHPVTAPAAVDRPEPRPAGTSRPPRRGLPGARLPFGRRSKTATQ